VPPDVAAVAFDAVLADLWVAHGAAVVGTPAGRLALERPDGAANPGPGYLPLRQARGSLCGRLRPSSLTVLVEVLPWSARMAEVMLRIASPSSRRPTLIGSRAYLRAAITTVEVLAASVERWPVGFLGGLAVPPSALAVPWP
jgi:hypothetical protein